MTAPAAGTDFLSGLLSHVGDLTKDPNAVSGILDKVKGALSNPQGKEQIMGFVNKISDMAHDPKAAEALHGVADKLKAQGIDTAHIGDALKNAVSGDKTEMMSKLQAFASQHGIDASSLQGLASQAQGLVGQATEAVSGAGASAVNAASGAAQGAAAAAGNAAQSVAGAVASVVPK